MILIVLCQDIIIKSRREYTQLSSRLHTHLDENTSYHIIHLDTHSHLDIHIMQHTFIVRYQIPYGDCQWRTQSFNTIEEAQRMVAFYISCGSPARLV